MKIVIAGAGAVGTHLSKLLSTEHHDCVLIDDNEERLEGVDANYDIMALCQSPTSIKTLKDAGVVSGGDMTTEGALGKLFFLMGEFPDNERVKTLLGKNMRGEISK